MDNALDLSFLEPFKTSEDNLPSDIKGGQIEPITEPTEATQTTSKWISNPQEKKLSPEELERQLIAKEKRQLKKDREQAQKIQLDNAKRIANSSEYRIQLCKGSKSGEPIENLLLLACNCISELTGDTAFLTTVEKNLKS